MTSRLILSFIRIHFPQQKISLQFCFAIFISIALLFFSSCHPNKKEAEEKKEIAKTNLIPQFNPDSSYQFVQAQVDFGPRIPNTKQHEECVQYLIDKFKSY